jgi:beta-fructofuranosidase
MAAGNSMPIKLGQIIGMRILRRDFVRTLGASSACASLPPFLWKRQAQGLRERLAADPLRPQFHLLPAKNWMNDPNGPIYWNGRYHMFFQYNPSAAVWGDMHWAHAVSEDMIHWRHLPVALAPTPGWDDADGCFTGSVVNDHGTATILYTGVKSCAPERATLRDGVHSFREVQCLATSSDPQLLTWNKWKEPVIQPPNDARLAGFRDPFLWRDGETWFLGVGSGLFKEGGCVLLYRSKDLRAWEYLHPLASGRWMGKESANPVESGEMWECPDFFRLGMKHVLLYSTAGQVLWESGELDPKENTFHSEKRGVLDHGAYYAQKTQLDARGNRILWGWIPETRPEAEFGAAGWAGCMGLPRVLSLNSEGSLEMQIAPEAQSLRGKAFTLPQEHKDSSPLGRTIEEIQLENLAAEITWSSNSLRFSFTLADGSGSWWSARLEPKGAAAATLTVNGISLPVPLGPKHEIEFHLFLDASVAELICDRLHALTTRVYHKPDGPLRVRVSDSDMPSLTSLTAWQLRPISLDRLTT